MQVIAVAVLLALLLAACGACGGPVDQTAYGKSSLRFEFRPDPLHLPSDLSPEQLEAIFAEGGAGARWISVVSPLGQPYYRSDFLPTDLDRLDEREARLKRWVAAIHSHGLPVMSWYPLVISKSSHDAHPEWRQEYIVEGPEGKHRDIECCFNTGYGQALIDFSNEAIDKFGLDGIWFDGSAWTQIWDRPLPLSCVCPSCRRLFKEQTGLDIPSRVDWSDPTFRRWVAWRYDSFGSYIGRLAAGIRAKHPDAAVVINHYHRPAIPWQSAIPLNPYPADIISGSEATGEGPTDLTTRLCRAYGRAQSEVWMPIYANTEAGGSRETEELIHHALTCVTAGGMPSYGSAAEPAKVGPILKQIATVLDKVRPYVCSESVPYAALHLSQQSETFHFSRDPKGVDWSMEPYWKSIMGWTQGLMQGHISCDYLYDKQLTPQTLRPYSLLLMPMSQALSDEQCRTIVDFARNGGTVMLGLGAGALDEWGEPRAANPLERAFGFHFGSVPSPAANELVAMKLSWGSDSCSVDGLYSPLELNGDGWRTLYTVRTKGRAFAPAVAVRPLGKGKVIVVAVDMGGASASGFTPVVGGDTSMAVTDETAAQGRHSLKFVDGPDAPRTFYPDMEIRFASFGPPEVASGRLSCALKLGKGARVHIEGRESKPRLGPSISIGRDGRLWAQNKPLCEAPVGEWFRVSIDFRFGESERSYDVTLTPPDGAPRVFRDLPYIDTGFDGCDWFVIYGEGTDPAQFYLDDLRIEGLPADASQSAITAFANDFELTQPGKLEPVSPSLHLAADLLDMAPAPVELDAPESVRMGVFRRGKSEVVVHLHNTDGSPSRTTGTAAKLVFRMSVNEAELAISGEKLPVKHAGGVAEITVPSVALHEVVVVSVE